ncbi:unnamed protein product [Calypogeia fissa]
MAGDIEKKQESIEKHRQRVEFAEIPGQLLTNWAADERVVIGGQFLPQLEVALAAWGVTNYFETDWRQIVLPISRLVPGDCNRPEAKMTRETQTSWAESGRENNANDG